MEAEHDSKFAGHMGVFKMMERIARKYWWPEMRKEVSEWIKTYICKKKLSFQF